MAKNDEKRFYWLQLGKDFFNGYKVQILEGMPNGINYSYFYIKLLCESCSHEGELRYSPTQPYTASQLALLTKTNIKIVKEALKVLKKLELIQIYEDGTIYLPKVKEMTMSLTGQTLRKKGITEVNDW